MNQNEGLSQRYNNEVVRFVAKKVAISGVLDGVERVNLLGTVISVQKKDAYKNVFIDDGTGSILVRVFEGANNSIVDIGDIIQVIGRSRMFGLERYITAEIITKQSDTKWIAVRKKEMEVMQRRQKQGVKPIPNQIIRSYEDCIDVIRNKDSGDGVEIATLVSSGIREESIDKLLKNGTIFETQPGKVKILE